MKLGIYLHNLSGDGAERVMLSIMQPLQQMGVQITLLLHDHDGALIDMVPKDVAVIGFDTKRTVNDLLPMVEYLRRERPDAVLANLNHNNVVALAAKVVALSRSKVYICQHNALSSESDRSAPWDYRVVPLCYRVLFSAAAGIVAVSNGVADDLAALCHIRRERITTIYNPVIGPDFHTRMRERVDHPWLTDNQPVFIAAGRLVKQKNHAMLLRALARIKRGRLLILGAGPLQALLQDLASELGIAERVCFAGFVSNPLPYIRAASSFILPSSYEGFGNAIVEALGCGTPVIATDCPHGPSEILEGGRYGMLVPVDDDEALAQAMQSDRQWPVDMLRRRAADFTVRQAASKYFTLLNS